MEIKYLMTPEQLKKTRQFLGFTQKALAEKLGLESGAVYMLEKGKKKPSALLVKCLNLLVELKKLLVELEKTGIIP